jgi:hypothetical protein
MIIVANQEVVAMSVEPTWKGLNADSSEKNLPFGGCKHANSCRETAEMRKKEPRRFRRCRNIVVPRDTK